MFWKEHSYNFVKMFLNQAAIGLLGIVLYFSASKAENEVLKLILGIGSALFYLALVYNTAWGIGSKDYTPVAAGRKKAKPLTGMFIYLVSFIPSFLCALALVIGNVCDVKWLTSAGAIVAMVIDGMYVGIFTYGGHAVALYWYFLFVLPGLAVSGVAYYLGMKGVRMTPAGTSDYPKSDRPTRAEMKNRREAEEKKEEKSDSGNKS